jgi:putative hydrolase of the HAD superfamily
LEDFFYATVIASDYGFRKPDPRLFHIALAALDVSASEAAYVGNDYETDFLGAKAAGLAMAGLIRQPEDQKKAFGEIIKPDFVTDDLPGALKKISKNKRGMAALKEKQHE